MITNEDIKKLIAVFTTREEVKQVVRDLEENTSTKKQVNEVLNRVDAVFGELKTIREEFSIHRLEHDDIDKRLAKIESMPVIAHDLKK